MSEIKENSTFYEIGIFRGGLEQNVLIVHVVSSRRSNGIAQIAVTQCHYHHVVAQYMVVE